MLQCTWIYAEALVFFLENINKTFLHVLQICPQNFLEYTFKFFLDTFRISLIYGGGKRRKQEAGLSTSDPSEVYKPYDLQYMNF